MAWLILKVTLVGNDINITRIDQVVWAMATRSHPERDYFTCSRKSLCSHRASPASFSHSDPANLQSCLTEKWSAYEFCDR
ncbi:TPA: UbiD family decarboxylase [Klebsiella pneumoniae]|nr:UbiD family decarboxylase [Klebsiella pneumoniae]